MASRAVILLFIVVTCNSANAGEVHLILSGTAIHADNSLNLNEENWGLGFEYDFDMRNQWIPFVTAVSFSDSNRNNSNYFGGGSKRRFLLGQNPDGLHLDLGVVGFMMKRRGFNNDAYFPGVLPFASVGNKWLAINMTYVPKIDPKMVEFIYFQAMVKVWEF